MSQVQIEYKRVHSDDEERMKDVSQSNTVAEKMTWSQSNPQDDVDHKSGEMTSKMNPQIGADHKLARERRTSSWSGADDRMPKKNSLDYMRNPLSDIDLQVARARGLVSPENGGDKSKEIGDTSNPESNSTAKGQNTEPVTTAANNYATIDFELTDKQSQTKNSQK